MLSSSDPQAQESVAGDEGRPIHLTHPGGAARGLIAPEALRWAAILKLRKR